MTHKQNMQAWVEGWGIFHTGQQDDVHNIYELQRIDEVGKFADDTAAIKYVATKAFENPNSIYGDAIRFLIKESPAEIEVVMRSVFGDKMDELILKLNNIKMNQKQKEIIEKLTSEFNRINAYFTGQSTYNFIDVAPIIASKEEVDIRRSEIKAINEARSESLREELEILAKKIESDLQNVKGISVDIINHQGIIIRNHGDTFISLKGYWRVTRIELSSKPYKQIDQLENITEVYLCNGGRNKSFKSFEEALKSDYFKEIITNHIHNIKK